MLVLYLLDNGVRMKTTEAIKLLSNKQSLKTSEIQLVFDDIFMGKVVDDDVRRFLVLLHEKGESFEEILGAVKYLRAKGKSLSCSCPNLIDCCGTGGDQKNTFNISTAVSFVLAGAGCTVAKHGNRAMSSQSGSADILTELGVGIQSDTSVDKKCLEELGIGFLFAPDYYPLMKKVASIRKSIPHRTIFNILGPLLNPAGAKKQLIGVFDTTFAPVMARVLQETGSESAVVVTAKDGTDEFSLVCDNDVVQLAGNEIKEFSFDPRESGYPYCTVEDLKGGTAKENADRLKKCLKGHSMPLDHVVHINSAWGLIAAGKADSLLEGLLMAQESISSGRAYQKLEGLIEMTKG